MHYSFNKYISHFLHCAFEKNEYLRIDLIDKYLAGGIYR